jgi:hypothetical protein
MWNAMRIDQKDRTVPAVSRTSGFRKGHWIRYAFFETPTVFRVDLGTPGSPREDWVTVRLRLAEWVWKLSELRLPT